MTSGGGLLLLQLDLAQGVIVVPEQLAATVSQVGPQRLVANIHRRRSGLLILRPC